MDPTGELSAVDASSGGAFPSVPLDSLPHLSSSQMTEVDRVMTEELGVDLLQMMELAGANLARLARSRYADRDPWTTPVVVLAGPGGNGGGALVFARRWSEWGGTVHVFRSREAAELSPAAAHQLRILDALSISSRRSLPSSALDAPAFIVDGLVGYGLRGSPRGRSAELIGWANGVDAPILSLDIASGLDATTGVGYPPVIEPDATMTLALPKTGLTTPQGRAASGEIYLADIGIPDAAWTDLVAGERAAPPFDRSEILLLT